MEIINPVHREFIENTDDFKLAVRLGLRHCGSCSAYGALSLVMPEAPVTILHHYAESAGCLELPVCDSCIGEGVLDPSQDQVDSMESCRSDLCSYFPDNPYFYHTPINYGSTLRQQRGNYRQSRRYSNQVSRNSRYTTKQQDFAGSRYQQSSRNISSSTTAAHPPKWNFQPVA